MNVALTLSIVPASNVTACALVRTYTETGIAYDIDGVGTPFTREVEVRRVEFVACDDFVWTNAHGTWSAEPRETARARYKNLVAEGYVKTDAKTEIVGQCDAPATREEYAWGEGANRVGTAEIPAQVGPVIRTSDYRGAYTRLLRAFSFTTPDKWTSLRTEFSRVDEETMSVKLCVHA
jgi:hypothetical protein